MRKKEKAAKVSRMQLIELVDSFHLMQEAKKAFEQKLYALPQEYLRPFRFFSGGGKAEVMASLSGEPVITKRERELMKRLADVYQAMPWYQKETHGEGTKEVQARRSRQRDRSGRAK